MPKLSLHIFAILVATYSSGVLADGNKLLSQCNTAIQILDGDTLPKNAYIAASCLGLVQGITNLNLLYQVDKTNNTFFCLPAGGINNGQAARIVVKYLKEHPEKLHENESVLAIAAFVEAYPCSRNK